MYICGEQSWTIKCLKIKPYPTSKPPNSCVNEVIVCFMWIFAPQNWQFIPCILTTCLKNIYIFKKLQRCFQNQLLPTEILKLA